MDAPPIPIRKTPKNKIRNRFGVTAQSDGAVHDVIGTVLAGAKNLTKSGIKGLFRNPQILINGIGLLVTSART